VLRNRTEYELSEQLDDATEKQISLYQQVVEGDKAKLVDYTTTCAGKKRSIIKVGAAKCGLSELDQRLMTPFS
ncbi:MAG TPA: hypothetical protein VFL85_00405, partial [Candidatus Saccharimonadales bacterium]|nr:hypothetical protein [Candidatus Saccharimonadales bacterium]